ncbi:DNA cytosine methyltransferase, partial [bacterium AH-315-K05]|nr:DNA cytosine methyltransferase [bacterium AH-315-K05]
IPDYPYISHENVGGSVTPHDFSCALRAGASSNYLLLNNIRRLSSREMLRIQGFPETYKFDVSYTQTRKQAGNSVAVPVIAAVAREMDKSLTKDKESIKYATKCERCVG